MTLKKILVPLDGSKNSLRGLREAIKLAKQTNASITGLLVVQAFPTEIGIIRTVIDQALNKKFRNFMAIAKRQCSKSKIKFNDMIEYGSEGAEIVSFAQKYNFDLIVIGARGLGSVKEFFLGSTSNYVVHNSKIPVLIVK